MQQELSQQQEAEAASAAKKKEQEQYKYKIDKLLDSGLLKNINEQLQHKRDAFGGDGRLRRSNLICDIISPNHVSLRLPEESVALNQWIPTEFMLKFKNNKVPKLTDDVSVSDFLDVELRSGFIPDLNCKTYTDLEQYILTVLRRKMIPMFVEN